MKTKNLLTAFTFVIIPVLVGLLSINWNSGKTIQPMSIIVRTGSGDDCSGTGLCDMQLEGAAQEKGSDYDFKGGILLNEYGQLELVIPSEEIDEMTAKTQFIENEFRVQKDFLLPPEVVQSLGLEEKNSFLKAGKYIVSETKDKYKIIFNVYAGTGKKKPNKTKESKNFVVPEYEKTIKTSTNEKY